MSSAQREKAEGSLVDVDPISDPRWNAFVREHPDGLAYHHSAWLGALSAESGQEPIGLAYVGRDGSFRGILPLLATRGFPLRWKGELTARRLSSLPRTPVAGPLAIDRDATTALVRGAVDRVARTPGTTLQFKVEGPALDGVTPAVVGVRWRPTYVAQLPESPQQLRFGNSRNHARLKWSVAKARRLGLRVRAADSPADLRRWYRLYLETMRFHVVPPRSYGFFAALWDSLLPIDQMQLLLAERGKGVRTTLLSGSLFLGSGRTLFYAFTGSRRDSLSTRANDLVMWDALQRACQRGFRYCDLGEVAEGSEGLAQFKRKWGTDERWLYRYYYPPPEKPEVLAGHGRAQLAVRAAWRRVPLRATAVVGRLVYRYL